MAGLQRVAANVGRTASGGYRISKILLGMAEMGSRAANERGRGLQPCGLCKVHAEPIPPALIAPRHLGRNVSELFLNIALVDFGR